MKFTRQGKRIYDNAIQETYDPKGEKHFWIGGGTPTGSTERTQILMLFKKGYVSITPIHLDLTNYSAWSFCRKPCSQYTSKHEIQICDAGYRSKRLSAETRFEMQGQDTGNNPSIPHY